ncbi:MAG TPA: pyridoxamine 5'-phosphate oxidase family protein [Acidimicrobiia bacterium]
MTEPRRDRPEMPAGYGVDQADDFVAWEDVEERLRESLHYWLATTRPNGQPHVVPRWGVWLDGAFWYDGSPETVHVRNLEENPNIVLHLESGTEVTVVEGQSIRPDPITGELGERLAAEYARKYAPEYTPPADAWSDGIAGGMRTILPIKVIAWSNFPKDLTRFTL